MSTERHDTQEMEDRLALLADAYLHGEITPDGLAKLEALVASDPEAARLFACFVQQSGMMRELYGSANEQVIATQDQDSTDFLSALAALEESDHEAEVPVDLTDELLRRAQQRKQAERLRRAHGANPGGGWSVPPLVVVGAIAAVCLLAFWLGGVFMGQGSGGGNVGPGQATPPREAFAGRSRLIATHQAVWGEGYIPHPGENLQDTPIRLTAGLARIEMGNGTTLLVEGPAYLRISGAGQVELSRGRVTAVTPAGRSPLTIQTPNATIQDSGSTFGVHVDPANQTTAQVYTGQVSLTPMTDGVASAAAIPLSADRALRVDATGQHVDTHAVSETAFIGVETFEALQGRLGPEPYAAAVRRMWEHDPELIAALSYHPDQRVGVYGFESRLLRGQVGADSRSLSPRRDSELSMTGGRLEISEAEATTLFLDLDLASSGPAARAGLVRSDMPTLGRDGTRVCLSWMMRLESGDPQDPAGWCGVSLFGIDDNRDLGEYLFIGRIAHEPALGVTCRRSAPDQPESITGNIRLSKPGMAPPPAGRTMHWLVVIDFRDGADQISIYVDPSLNRLGNPDIVIDNIDLRLDRLRLEAADGNHRWSFDEFRVGTDVRAVLRN